jgi:RNA polymerase sigma-70 factor (ECF subfamily)
MATKLATGMQESDYGLIQAGRHGDVHALNTLFYRHQRTLFHYALGIMGNSHDAEDALQDGLLSAFRNLKSFNGQSQFSTWLTRVVINAALMRRRGQAVRLATAAAQPLGSNELPIVECLVSRDPNPEQLFGRLEVRGIIKDHLDELTPILRTAFVLRRVREYSTSDTARILRVSEETLRSRLLRARRALAKRVSRSLLLGLSSRPDDKYET